MATYAIEVSLTMDMGESRQDREAIRDKVRSWFEDLGATVHGVAVHPSGDQTPGEDRETRESLSMLMVDLHLLLSSCYSETVSHPDVEGMLEDQVADLAKAVYFVAGAEEARPPSPDFLPSTPLARQLREFSHAVRRLWIGLAKGAAHEPSPGWTRRH